jgi:hypothetical protein
MRLIRTLIVFLYAGVQIWVYFAPCAVTFAETKDAEILAAGVDAHLADRWIDEGATPAPPTDDASFARRAYLDLVGHIPTAAQVRSFVDEQGANKRATLVERLLSSGGYGRHWATVWRREWIPQGDQPQSVLGEDVEPWLASQLGNNISYDQIVFALLTAPTARLSGGAPRTFLVASEFKPENLAANSARALLGVNLDCAQCHNHPFAQWTRGQFWETAAFFGRPPAAKDELPEIVVQESGTTETFRPKLLTGDAITWPTKIDADTGRLLIAQWMTRKENPYFAKNAMNRLWAQLCGAGVVEPLDSLSTEAPELLDELAKAFADSGFDLKYMIEVLTRTRAYQLSLVRPIGDISNSNQIAQAPIRGLTGEQLYDSLRIAAGLPSDRTDLDPLYTTRTRKLFAERFRLEHGSPAQRSILQSLTLMNGSLTAELTNSSLDHRY